MPQADLLAHIRSILTAHVKPGSRLVLGLSGGVDSVALLDMLLRLREEIGFDLSALHINHQLSTDAGRWAEFCRQLCQAKNIPIEVMPVSVARTGAGLEAAAREKRYRIFSEQQADYLVLAQHMDDQAETLLLQMLRGSGVKGLGAMPLIRNQHGCRGGAGPLILRPLLERSRREIEAYARERGLQWVEDESNADIGFDRNFLRHEIFPKLEQRFPAYRTALLRASRNLAEASQLLDELAQADAETALSAGSLDLEAVGKLNQRRARNLLRYFLAVNNALMPSARRLEEILHQLLAAGSDAKVHLRTGEFEILRFRGRAYVRRSLPAVDPHQLWQWNDEPEMRLASLEGTLHLREASGAGISIAKLKQEPVTIRLRQGGERIKPDCNRPTRSLKNLLQEAGIPPWQRSRLPLICSGAKLVWAAGVGVDCEYRAGPEERGILPEWRLDIG